MLFEKVGVSKIFTDFGSPCSYLSGLHPELGGYYGDPLSMSLNSHYESPKIYVKRTSFSQVSVQYLQHLLRSGFDLLILPLLLDEEVQSTIVQYTPIRLVQIGIYHGHMFSQFIKNIVGFLLFFLKFGHGHGI